MKSLDGFDKNSVEIRRSRPGLKSHVQGKKGAYRSLQNDMDLFKMVRFMIVWRGWSWLFCWVVVWRRNIGDQLMQYEMDLHVQHKCVSNVYSKLPWPSHILTSLHNFGALAFTKLQHGSRSSHWKSSTQRSFNSTGCSRTAVSNVCTRSPLDSSHVLKVPKLRLDSPSPEPDETVNPSLRWILGHLFSRDPFKEDSVSRCSICVYI